uniref:Ig-like domain-containing protein n=1 Tax=Lates calcarifer TaxID=8187 RepID=A0A4W6ESN4_LATCA
MSTVPVTVTLQPNWPLIYRGETITVRCEIQGGGDTEWTYEWRPAKLNKPPSHNEYRNNRATVSDSGDYRCKARSEYFLTEWSDKVRLTVSLSVSSLLRSKNIFQWEVLFQCEIQGGGDTEWEYEWKTPTSFKPSNQHEHRISPASSSHSGDYRCKGRVKSSQHETTEWSSSVRLTVYDKKPKATLTPGSTIIPAGGSVTLTCSVNPSPGWKYFLTVTQLALTLLVSLTTNTQCRRNLLCIHDVAEKQRTANFMSDVHLTFWHVSVLIIYRGETITVRCEIQGGGDTEWEYKWKTPTSFKPSNQHEHRISPASSSHSGNYRCKGRVKSSQHRTTEWSSSVRLTVYDNLHPAASLTVNPDRVQHFTFVSVSLSCEGNSTEWRVKRFNEHGYQSHCSDWRRMTGSICKVYLSSPINAVYWCESGSGEFSNAVNITVQSDYHGIILVSPVHPVTEGKSVSLGCRTEEMDEWMDLEEKLSSVFFYHNDKLIQSDTRQELNISAVSKSDEGFYKCQWSGRKSAQSWMSVKVGAPLLITESTRMKLYVISTLLSKVSI